MPQAMPAITRKLISQGLLSLFIGASLVQATTAFSAAPQPAAPSETEKKKSLLREFLTAFAGTKDVKLNFSGSFTKDEGKGSQMTFGIAAELTQTRSLKIDRPSGSEVHVPQYTLGMKGVRIVLNATLNAKHELEGALTFKDAATKADVFFPVLLESDNLPQQFRIRTLKIVGSNIKGPAGAVEDAVADPSKDLVLNGDCELARETGEDPKATLAWPPKLASLQVSTAAAKPTSSPANFQTMSCTVKVVYHADKKETAFDILLVDK